MVTISSVPDTEKPCGLYKVKAGGNEAGVYCATVSAIPFNRVWPGHQRPVSQTEEAAFVCLQADGPFEVSVTLPKDFEEVTVRPLRHGIKTAVEGRTAVFTLPGAGQYTFEPDGFANALHIFVDPIREKPDLTDDDISFGPGVHRPGLIELHSGQTLYIAPGAVVYGGIMIRDAHDVKVCGGGVIDDSWETRTSGDCIVEVNGCLKIHDSRDILIEDVVCRDSAIWTATIFASEHVTFDRVKTIGMWRYNSDGIDFVNCSHCTIDNCFLRNFDDCAVIKGLKGWDKLSVTDIKVLRTVVWCDWGRNLEFGAETCADSYTDILFEDCDMIHGAHIYLDIQNGDRARVDGVVFRNIRCEYSRYTLHPQLQDSDEHVYDRRVRAEDPRLINGCNYRNVFSHDDIPGSIHNVLFEDIYVLADDGVGMPEIGFDGRGPESPIDGVTIRGLYFNGRRITDPKEANMSHDSYCSNIVLE